MISEFQKIIFFFDKKSYQPSKIKTKNWVDRNDDSYGTYNSNSKLNLRVQCYGQVIVIIMMHIYLLKELYRL